MKDGTAEGSKASWVQAPARARAGTALALRFGLTSAALTLALFGLLRLPVVEKGVVVPLTRLQQALALGGGGGQAALVEVTTACSGTDVLALCLGVMLAYPASWRRRQAGAAAGLALVLGLNTLRIGTLAGAAGTPLFLPLHLYLWPAALTLVTLGYVVAWMRTVEGPRPGGYHDRFALVATPLVVAFVGATPWLSSSPVLAAAADAVARAAAALLTPLGVPVIAAGGMLGTPQGAFLVTAECVLTPLLPVFLAAVLALRQPCWARGLLALAAIPLFAALTVARLLTLALPPLLAPSPLVLTHAFHQLVLAAALVVGLALSRPGPRPRALAWGLAALAAGLASAALASGAYTPSLLALAGSVRPLAPHALTTLTWAGDDQGALALLPVYQAGLCVALWMAAFRGGRRRSLLEALALLVVSHVLLLLALGELLAHAGVRPHALAVRAWAAVGPPLALWVVAARRREMTSAGADAPAAAGRG